MKRSNFILVLALVGVAAAIGYGIVSDRASRSTIDERIAEAERNNAEALLTARYASSRAFDEEETQQVAPANVQENTRTATRMAIRTDLTHEHREGVRAEASEEVTKLYSMLLDDLDVSPKQRDDLMSLLIENRVAATTKLQVDERTSKTGTIVVRGKPLSVEERSQRIAAIVGEIKLQRFLALERNLPAYSEVQALASVLETNGVPLTDSQRDRLLEQVVLTREQYLVTSAKPVESIEDLEQRVAAQNEYERHVLELAPSVLSAKQVPLVSDQYQYWSELRARNLQAQEQQLKKWKAERPNEKPFLFIPDQH